MNEQEKHQQWKDKVLRVKTICLDEIGKPPLTNVSLLSKQEKELLFSKVEDYMLSLNEEDIVNRFNKLVCEKVLSETSDYFNYPIYERIEPKTV